MVVKTIEYRSLDEVIEMFNKTFDDKYIFRGQSNGTSDTNEEWELVSSYKRYFDNSEIPFRSFIINNLDKGIYDLYFSNYKYADSEQIAKAPFIEKLYYFQHYGIPTCLIDFSKNPLVALYFAISTLKIPAVKKNRQDKSISLGEDRYITIYQIDTEILKEKFHIKEITDRDFCFDYDQFEIPYNTQTGIKIAFDLNPLKKIKFLDNYNLKNQQGCFLLFDNTESANSISFENTIEHINQDHLKEEFKHPVITKHNLYLAQLISRDKSIFSFLRKEKNITGRNLFNDIQGLKYDLLQIHNNY